MNKKSSKRKWLKLSRGLEDTYIGHIILICDPSDDTLFTNTIEWDLIYVAKRWPQWSTIGGLGNSGLAT